MVIANSCKTLPSIEEIENILFYDREAGKLIWRREKWPQWNGKLAGNRTPFGYQRIKINKSLYLAHRLAWKLENGEDPGEFEVDHIDLNPQNNRPGNLRLATHGKNQCNGGPYKNNKSGYRGVYWSVRDKKYIAQIQCNKKSTTIGRFSSEIEAAKAYDDAAIRLFGEFAKPNFADRSAK